MHVNHTQAQLNLQQVQQRGNVQNQGGNRHVLMKMDRIFYDCIMKIKRKYFWWILFHAFKTLLVIALIPINSIILNGFKDSRILIQFILAAFASLVQVISRSIYHILILSNNNLLLLKISVHLNHSTQQPINGNPQQIKNCISLREYNHQTHTLIAQSFYMTQFRQTRQKQLISSIKQQSHKRYKCIYIVKKIADITGLLSMFYTLYVLMSGLETNVLEILMMYGEFLVEFLGQMFLLAIFLFVLLLPVIGVAMLFKCCYNNCKCEEGWWKFKPNEQKRQLPQQTKITQKMINQSDGLCTICLEEFKINQDVVVLKCSPKHIFHPQCIETWIEYRKTCPNCRLPIKVR